MTDSVRYDQAVYVVEYVGLNPLLWMWLAWGRACRVNVRYAGGNPRLIRWWQRLFPAGDFEKLIGESSQTWEAHLRLYELIEQQTPQIERSYTARRFQRFFSHPQMGRTLRRVMRRDAFDVWFASLEVERWLACGLVVRLFPAWDRLAIRKSCPTAWGAVPRSYGVVLRMQQWIGAGLCSWVIALGRVMLGLRDRGLRLRPPRLQQWGIAQKAEPSLSITRIPDHELIFADDDLHPSHLLHVVEEKDLSPESRAHFQALGSTVVCPERLPMPIGYALKRVGWDFLLKFVGSCALVALRSPLERELLMAAIRLGRHIISCEVFAQYHRPRVYFGWDTYSALFNVRTMVWERTGTRCVGYIHASPAMPLAYYHGLYAHVLLVSGARIRDMFGRTLEACGRVIPIGHMQTELSLDAIPPPPHPGHLVAAFDTSCDPAWGQSHAVLRDFYRGLLTLLKAHPSLTIVLKRKYDSRQQPNRAYEEIAGAFGRHPRIQVCCQRSAYDLIAEADSVIAITISTTGLEALACRKPTVFFDPRPNHAGNPYRRYHPFLVCHTTDELVERYAKMLSGDYPAGLIDAVVRSESLFADERPLSRVRGLLLAEAGCAAAGEPLDLRLDETADREERGVSHIATRGTTPCRLS